MRPTARHRAQRPTPPKSSLPPLSRVTRLLRRPIVALALLGTLSAGLLWVWSEGAILYGDWRPTDRTLVQSIVQDGTVFLFLMNYTADDVHVLEKVLPSLRAGARSRGVEAWGIKPQTLEGWEFNSLAYWRVGSLFVIPVDHRPFYKGTFVGLPLWCIAAALAMPVGLAALGARLRRYLRRRRGQCVDCGYDLYSNTTGVCPECGCATRPEKGDSIGPDA